MEQFTAVHSSQSELEQLIAVHSRGKVSGGVFLEHESFQFILSNSLASGGLNTLC
jgi:hypothetical protein